MHTGNPGYAWTGQRSCHDVRGTKIPCHGSGQDAEFHTGATWPEPRFEIHRSPASRYTPESPPLFKGASCLAQKGGMDNNTSTYHDLLVNLSGMTQEQPGKNTSFEAAEQVFRHGAVPLSPVELPLMRGSSVLKGALMFTAWQAPVTRPTMDIDLLGITDNSGLGDERPMTLECAGLFQVVTRSAITRPASCPRISHWTILAETPGFIRGNGMN